MNDLMAMMKKKKEKSGEMSDDSAKAKMGVLKELRGIANDEISKDLPGLKKVTVAAPDKEGLEAGLEKAEDLVEGGAMEKMDEAASENEEEPSMMGSEAYQEAMNAIGAMSEDERKKLMHKLMSEAGNSSSEDEGMGY